MTALNSHSSGLHSKAKKAIGTFLLASSLLISSPHVAMASKADDDADHYDARVQGYEPNVELPATSNGACWALLIGLGVMCISVIFKDAKRSHLD